MKVYFIGAGPGDPELMTLKGARLVSQCPVILYTGSLVPPDVLQNTLADARILDTAGMDLDDILAEIEAAKAQDLDVARVHTGDPAIFGSTAEQYRRLRAMGIEYEVVPGVSSFLASAAALGQELTLPEVSQTVIISRAEGRTPVPSGQELASMAKHQATLVLFLSVTLLQKVTSELIPAYGADCPVAVVHRASWPGQKIIRGTLSNIRQKIVAEKVISQSIIIVGRVLSSEDFPDSRLYAADFSHRFRKARD